MNKMFKQLQKMQTDVLQAQERLGERTVEATAGGGVIKVLVSGARELKGITISPEAADPADLEMLQDLIVAAVNEGLRKAEAMAEEELKKATGGLGGLPGMLP
ncbi:MAG: YbaB/EbfC family nucleoid-associated protein [Firmicutes bacterium]|nr:YbaB/EbfC family nucleoid-associated protein [Bacillota bacterium]